MRYALCDFLEKSEAMMEKAKIGLIGLGLMGTPMPES